MISVYQGAPQDAGARAENEQAVYRFLDALGVSFARADHPAANTMADCQAVDAALGVEMCKNLFLCNQQKTQFYLLLIRGERAFKTKDISHQLGVSRLSFGDAEHMEALLHIRPGAVSPMGLLFESAKDVRLLMDRALLEQPFLGCHPCVNTSSLRLAMPDFLERFLPATGHSVTYVDIP